MLLTNSGCNSHNATSFNVPDGYPSVYVIGSGVPLSNSGVEFFAEQVCEQFVQIWSMSLALLCVPFQTSYPPHINLFFLRTMDLRSSIRVIPRRPQALRMAMALSKAPRLCVKARTSYTRHRHSNHNSSKARHCFPAKESSYLDMVPVPRPLQNPPRLFTPPPSTDATNSQSIEPFTHRSCLHDALT